MKLSTLKSSTLWLTLLLLTLALPLRAQSGGMVKGVVLSSEDNQPLIGATIVVKERPSVGTVTDFNGSYTINAAKNEHLIFSFIGFEQQEITIDSYKIDVTMKSNMMLEEIVKIGYAPIRKKELTGAAIQVKGEDIENVVSADLGMALQGMVPGLSITASSGDPGSVANIQIRGVSSMSGDNTPLFVVDGIPQEGNPDISSNEIASLDILKDAASCAIYGTRGAAGVILITTKQGEKGGLKVNFDAVYGVQYINTDRLPNLLNTEQQTYVEILEGRLDGQNDMEVNYRLTKNPDYYLNDTEALDMIMRDGITPEQSYNLTLSGGGNEIRYSMVFGYYNQLGLMENSSYDRYNMRTNFNYAKNRWKINLSTSYVRDDKYTAAGSSFTNVINFKPYTPEIDRNDDVFIVPGEGYSNEVSTIEPLLRQLKAKNNDKKSTFTTNVGADYEILKTLSFTTKLGYNNQTNYGYSYVPNISIYDSVGEEVSKGPENSSVSNDVFRRESINWYGGLNYSETFNKHKLTGMAIVSYELYDYKGFGAGAYGIQNGVMNDAVLDMGTFRTWADSYNYYTDHLFGTVGRLMYSYDDRYLLSGSVRADASSKFSKENRWGFFPSLSGGWNISEEEFWRPFKRTVNAFKLRASYGMTGNQNFTSYSYMNSLAQGYDYVYGSDIEYGQSQINYANPDVKWETTVQTNVGLDLAFLSNSITFSADVYNTDKRDMLARVRLPASVGAGTGANAIVTQNVGNMTNRGIELQLNYNKSFKNGLKINTGVNFSKNVNEVTQLATGNTIMYNSNSILVSGDPNSVVTAFAEGYEAGAFFLYKNDGVIKSQEELDAYQNRVVNGQSIVFHPDAKVGDLRFVDTNGDGVLSDADRAYCGSGMPDFEIGFNLGFTYKGFDLMTNWFASVGAEVMNGTKAISFDRQRNESLIYQWSETNQSSDIPAWRGNGKENMNYIGYSDMWVEDGSYLRLKAITLGYTFPKKSISKLKLSNLRLYLTGQNLFTLTGYSGMDPELGGDGLTTRGLDKGQYPISKKVMMGLKLGF